MGVNVILDIILGVVGLIILIKFTVKGFFKSVFDTLKLVLSVALAFLLRFPISRLLDSWFFNAKMTSWVKDSLLSTIAGESKAVDFAKIYSEMPSFFDGILSKFGLKEGIGEQLNNLSALTEEKIDELAVQIGSSLSSMISTVVAVIVMFILSLILLSILSILINKLLTQFEGVRITNYALGFVLGLVIALATLWALCLGVEVLVQFVGPIAPDLFNQEVIDSSMIMGFFKNINLIEWIRGVIHA